jgi:hypothetical protein
MIFNDDDEILDLVDNNDTTALIFLQGGFTDHLHTWFRGFNTPSEMIKAFLSDTHQYGSSITWATKHENVGGNAAHYNFHIHSHNGKQLYPLEKQGLGEWFRENLKQPFLENQLNNWWIAAMFCVHGINICRNNKTFYKNLLSLPNLNQLDPEVGHYFERSWVYIFGCDASLKLLDTKMQKCYLRQKGSSKLL